MTSPCTRGIVHILRHCCYSSYKMLISPFNPTLTASDLRFRFEKLCVFRSDFNGLVYRIARRPEYKTRERIHRGMLIRDY